MNAKFIKSIYDKNTYYTNILDNKFEYLIVTNENIEESYISLSVNIGTLNDTIMGISHFLEHLLFMGTNKYENINTFFSYIAMHGGYSNAYTSYDHTCYYYNIQSDYLFDSLDMFAHFFIDPMFKKETIKKELNAIYSEHSKNINNDNWKLFNIIKLLHDSDHPFRKFGTGNEETLNIDNIRDKLIEYYEKFYIPQLMKLVIVTNKNINDVDVFIKNVFSLINNKNTLTENNIIVKKNINNNYFIKYITIEDINLLSLIWHIPFNNEDVLCNSIDFLFNLIKNKSHYCLYDFLKINKYIYSLSTDVTTFINSYNIINLNFKLTIKGKQNIQIIIYYLNEYIKLLKNNIDYVLELYHENYLTNLIDFIYKEHNNYMDIANSLSSSWAVYNPKIQINDKYMKLPINIIMVLNILNNTNIDIKNILLNNINCILTSNFNIILGSHEHADIANEKNNWKHDKWYNTLYNLQQNEFKNINCINMHNKKQNLNLPKKNIYINTNVNVYDNDKKIVNIVNSRTKNIWICKDLSFDIPNLNINIIIEFANMNLKNHMIIKLYILYIKYLLTEDMYNANNAGYDVCIKYDNKHLIITIYGLSNNTESIINNIIMIIFKYHNINEQIFCIAKDDLKQKINNMFYNQPHELLFNKLNKLSVDNYFDFEDEYNILNNMTILDIQNNYYEILKQIKIHCFSHGNMNDHIINFIKLKIDNIITIPIDEYYNENKKYNNEPIEQSFFQKNKLEKNIAVGKYYKIQYYEYENKNFNYKIYALLNIFNLIIKDKFFDTLRTTEQIGYVVYSKIFNLHYATNPQIYYGFIVQSDIMKHNKINERITLFINETYANIFNLNINEYIKTFIDKIKKKFTSLQEKTLYYVKNIILNELSFNINEKIIENAEKITNDDLKNFMKKYIIDNKEVFLINMLA
jgi:insulysin